MTADAEPFNRHNRNCDEINQLLTTARHALTNADRLIDAMSEEDWGRDIDSRYADAEDATEHSNAALAHIRDMGRIVEQFRADAERYQQRLNNPDLTA